MLRLAFLLLLMINVAVGAFYYLNPSANLLRASAEPPLEVNRDKLNIISVADPGKAQQEAQVVLAARKLAESLIGSACVDFGVKPVDGARAQTIFAAMSLGDRLSSRNAEEFTRFAITMPTQKDKKAADTLVANLKKAGVKDVSALGDNSISLGVFSSDEAAKRTLDELATKASALIKGAAITPRSPQVKEVVFTIREPDTAMVARLSLMQRDFEASNLKAVTCAATQAEVAPPVAAVVAVPGSVPALPSAPATGVTAASVTAAAAITKPSVTSAPAKK